MFKKQIIFYIAVLSPGLCNWLGFVYYIKCMTKIFIRFSSVVLGLFIAEHFIPGVSVSSLYSAIIVALFLGVLNVIVRPVLIFLTLPITIATLGFFIFIVNAAIFLFVGTVVKGFYVDGFISALFGSIIVTVISWFVQKIT